MNCISHYQYTHSQHTHLCNITIYLEQYPAVSRMDRQLEISHPGRSSAYWTPTPGATATTHLHYHAPIDMQLFPGNSLRQLHWCLKNLGCHSRYVRSWVTVARARQLRTGGVRWDGGLRACVSAAVTTSPSSADESQNHTRSAHRMTVRHRTTESADARIGRRTRVRLAPSWRKEPGGGANGDRGRLHRGVCQSMRLTSASQGCGFAPTERNHTALLHRHNNKVHDQWNWSLTMHTIQLIFNIKKVKVAHTGLPSIGFRSWSRFFAVSLQVMWVINPAAGCHYFPPGPKLPSQPLRGLLPTSLLCEQRHDGCEQFA